MKPNHPISLALCCVLLLLSGCDSYTAEQCDDGTDNDGDGHVDCDDQDCAASCPDSGDDDDTGDDDTGDDDDPGDDDDTSGQDNDGDGFTGGNGDCDDTNPSVNTAADELCDDIDHDCDGDPQAGAIDASTWYEDEDGDGFGDAGDTQVACDQPHGYSAYPDDCNDDDPAFHPGASETDCSDPADYNCDGSSGYADVDGDGLAACEDCDDNNSALNTAALETCDGLDNDCDGQVDESGATGETNWYFDADGDGYGRTQPILPACSQPLGYVVTDDDCDDLNPSAYPGAPEICDEADNNCDGSVDEGSAAPTNWFADFDGDGFGSQVVSQLACTPPPGYIIDSSDCDDLDATAFPGGTEVCDDADNDCNGQVDEGVSTTFFLDGDGDGYGDPGTPQAACFQPTGYSANGNDCDDADPTENPGALEVCDGEDNDCDSSVDEGAINATTFYADSDGDGFGDLGNSIAACSATTGFINNSGDCNDNDTAINPGAVEIWYDGIDQDCSGGSDFDQDGDGHDSAAELSGGTDGNDLDPSCFANCRDGISQANAGITCGTILAQFPGSGDGTYWIDTDDDGDTNNAFQVFCDMTGGGWTYQSVASPFRVEHTGSEHSFSTVNSTAEYLFTLHGAAGGTGINTNGGLGGRASGARTFPPETTLHLYVGGQGDAGGVEDQGPPNTQSGGFNGGGRGTRGGSGGGGGTDLRTTLGDLNSRILVAGGGGGCGNASCNSPGGAGGGLNGGDGSTSGSPSGRGFGGSQTAGGTTTNTSSANGSFGAGGNNVQDNDEGGGGGGWYGGGAGSISNAPAGGGSSYYDGMDSDQATAPGINNADGYAEYVFR